MNRKRLLYRLARGSLRNIRFLDLLNLAEAFGFSLVRTSGSHHILTHPDVPELLNLQEVDAQAKPYQIRQFLDLVERDDLEMKEDKQ